jgi:hypothetical protein
MTQYRVTAVWWPDGWEPLGPLDVPNCIGRAPDEGKEKPLMGLSDALATVRGLNRQNMDHPGAVWYVAAEADASEPLKVVRNAEGGGNGDCSHCPASSFPCATEKL